MQMLEMIKNQLKLLLKNRAAFVATLALPLILTFFFVKAGIGIDRGQQVELNICDHDKSVYSEQYLKMLGKDEGILLLDRSEADIRKDLDAHTISLGVLIEKGFGQSLLSGGKPRITELETHVSEGNQICEQAVAQKYSLLEKIVSEAAFASAKLPDTDGADQFGTLYTLVTDSLDSPSNIAIHEENPKAAAIDDTARIFLGFMVLFLWMVIVQGCRTLIAEKENGTYTRILSTPILYNKFLAAKSISVFIYGLMHIAVIFIAGRLIFKLSCFDRIVPILMVLLLYLFAITGITLVIVIHIRSNQSFTAAAMGFVMLTGVLGGTMFPMEIAPGYIRVLSKFTPQGWAMPALTLTQSPAWAQALAVLAVAGIAGTALAFLLMNSQLGRREEKL